MSHDLTPTPEETEKIAEWFMDPKRAADYNDTLFALQNNPHERAFVHKLYRYLLTYTGQQLSQGKQSVKDGK